MNLWWLSLQELKLRPGRTVLTLFSIVIGVAVLVAVGMSLNTARTAFGKMHQSIAGEADLRIEARGGGRFSSQILAEVEAAPGVEHVAPLLRQSGLMYSEAGKVRLLLLGVDPGSDKELRNYQVVEGRYFSRNFEIMLEQGLAEALDVKVGDPVRFLTRRGLMRKQLVGILAPTGAAAFNNGSVAFWQLPSLQRAFSARDQVSSAYVMVNEDADTAAVMARLRQTLPSEVEVLAAGKQESQAKSARGAVETGLALAALVSIVAMGLVILNTFLMNLSERRRNMAILRVHGATRGQMLWLLMREAVFLGVLGSLLGLLIGYGLAMLLVAGMSAGFQVELPAPRLTVPWLAIAVVQGVVLVVLAVLYPVYRATTITPMEGFQRDLVAPHKSRYGRISAVVGTVFFAVACLLMMIQWSRSMPIQFAVIGPVMLLFAAVFLFPVILPRGIRIAGRAVRLFWPVSGHLAEQQLLRHRTRTHLTWAILFVAIGGSFAMGDVMMDAISDVDRWLKHTIRSEFVMRVTMPGEDSGDTAGMALALGDEIAEFPGVRQAIGVRFFSVGAGENRMVAVARQFRMSQELPLAIRQEVAPEEVRQQLLDGAIVLGAIPAQQLDLGPGDDLEIDFSGVTHRFPIAATCSVYALGGFAFYLDYGVAERVFGIEGADTFLIETDGSADPQLRTRLQSMAEEQGAILQSFQDFSRTIDKLLAGVTASLWALLGLAFLVALFGNANTLTMNVLEQTREIGLMRVVGMSRGHVRQYIISQALVYGLLALLPGLLGGYLVGQLVRSASAGMFGETAGFNPRSLVLAAYFLALFLLILVVAWIPARRASQVSMLSAVLRD